MIPYFNAKILFFLFFGLSLTFVTAQDPFFQQARPEIEEAARALTEKYTPELVLSSNQLLPFQSKVTEFLIRKTTIDDLPDRSTKEKLRLLKKLSKQENAEMQNILTRPQLRRYIKVKKRIQPIYVVVEK